MRILIVGSGSIARRHLANLRELQPEARIVLLRRVESATGPIPDEIRPHEIVHSLDDAVAEPIDAAIIASPAPFHADSALPLARRGVPLLVEKPIATDTEQAAALVRASRQNNSPLMIGYNLRFQPALRALRDAIHDGVIGRPLSLRAEVGQYLPDWRPDVDYRHTCSARRDLGGGALFELSHEIDYARWLLGNIESVSATIDQVSDLDIDVDDLAELNVRFTDGVVGSIHVDLLQRTPSRTCKVVGSEGTLVWDAIANRVELWNTKTEQWTELFTDPDTDRNAMYVAELQHFLDCVADNSEPLVTGDDGLDVLEVIQAARRSSDERKTISLAPPSIKMTRRTIAFVFARGGSKGLPGKNLRNLAGKPLVAHAIESAKKSEMIDRVVVSTEDQRIAEVALGFGAEVPFRRPAELASDTAAEWLAWQHAIRTLQERGESFHTFVSVPATAPLRTVENIDACIAKLNKHRDDTDVVITVTKAHRSPWFNMVTIAEDGNTELVMNGERRIHRRQDAPPVFDITTVAYAARPEYILSANGLFDGRVKAIVVETENAVDIDTAADFELAEFLLMRREAMENSRWRLSA